eukprot:CAMPEP_0172543864 /NCGR_PEP_ID=MMETSP1067-20121228/14144_1 /TAXON_ID=265564 ORGANISM="Thalassiosira punctigera, Strain Tpunct2005C2" /NCGR_SAMPLE_ID=MMETSP1067 /ASSEMBLY_ACC=CAM_ASM_000444 /LENGTH=367 /DNA_ID=CAMNT_0013330343 /DNA_START=266 /DNA_END=1369 /DNA_ORIENTATION=+
MTAPRSEKQRSQSRGGRGTSLGSGKVKTGHRVHGMKQRDDESQGGGRRARSKSRDRKPRARREYDTPFDDKGRCHYHKNVQLAAKKMTGGWKVLCSACPKCMEQKHDSGDDKSIKSFKSVKSSAAAGGKKFDGNGCCVVHSHIQIAKKKVLSGGWKVMRTCPSCDGAGDVGLDDDALSVKSGRSARSTSSRKSTKSAKSRGRPGKSTKSGRYGALPFDGDGYCCVHPSVQIAQKKMMGGFKIIHDVCPECAQEGGGSGGRGRNRSASRGRRSSSRHRGGKHDDDASTDDKSSRRKKRIRVKNLRTEDDNGRAGRYSGYVDDDHRPNGEGVMKYENGDEWEGVWSEGAQVHGKMRKGQSKKKSEKTRH